MLHTGLDDKSRVIVVVVVLQRAAAVGNSHGSSLSRLIDSAGQDQFVSLSVQLVVHVDVRALWSRRGIYSPCTVRACDTRSMRCGLSSFLPFLPSHSVRTSTSS